MYNLEVSEKIYKDKSKTALLLINVFAIILIFICFSYYSVLVLSQQQEDNTYNFLLSVESIKNTTENYLDSEQGYVDNWSKYINDSDMSLNDALAFLREINTNSNRVCNILDVESYLAYSTSINGTIDTYKTYIDYSSSFKKTIKKMIDNDSDSSIVLGKYYIKEFETFGVSLGRRIRLDNRDYLLLRVIPLGDISNTWYLSSDFSNGEVGLIINSGEYVIKPNSMKGETFIDGIANYNENYVDVYEDIKTKLNANRSGTLNYKNSLGHDTLWYYSAFEDNPDLYIIGCIEITELKDDINVWYITFFAILVVIILMIIDGIYLSLINKRLKKAYVEANKASLAKTEFLSVMSHDIRTPMNVVMGMNDLAYKNVNNPDMVKLYLDKSLSASKQLMTLINDILDINRIESGKLVINEDVVNLKQFGEQLDILIQAYGKEKVIKISHDFIDLDDVYVMCDETRVNQIYINLLSNAVKYTLNGGDVYYSLKASKVNDKCQLDFIVKDNGIGMSKDFQKNMFESFTRASDSRSSKVSGSGLGLTIVKKIVDVLNGEISCESELNKGTTFNVKLTFNYAENVVLTRSVLNGEISCESEINKGTTFNVKLTFNYAENVVLTGSTPNNVDILVGKRILIVEDNELNYEIVDSILEDFKTIRDHASNGKEAVDMVKMNKYDVILMDIHMPIMDGYKATTIIRTIDNNIPIIAMSANAFAEDVAKCRECGMNDHVAKPIDINKLKNALIKVL